MPVHSISANSLLHEYNSFAWNDSSNGSSGGSLQSCFSGETLAYVTPWNAYGYNVAKRVWPKLSWISPVWFQLKPLPMSSSQSKIYYSTVLTGEHDVDTQWMKDVRGCRRTPSDTSRSNSEEDDDSELSTRISVSGDMSANTDNDIRISLNDCQCNKDSKPVKSPQSLHNTSTQVDSSSQSTFSIRIVPRIILEDWKLDQLQSLISTQQNSFQSGAIQLIVDSVIQYDFDGITLEMTQAKLMLLQANRKTKQFADVSPFIIALANALHALKPIRSLVLVVSPHDVLFSRTDFALTRHVVDRFSLMTYDYSQHIIGPISPWSWTKSCVKRLLSSVPEDNEQRIQASRKMLIGLAFFGHDYEGQYGEALRQPSRVILGRDFMQLILEHKPETLQWHSSYSEHSFSYREKVNNKWHTVVYPTSLSIYRRLELARQLNVAGIAIWEIGQGLDFWYKLL